MSSESDNDYDRMDLRSGKQISSNTGARMKENSFNHRFQNTFKPTQKFSLLFPNAQKGGESKSDMNKHIQNKFPQDVRFVNDRNDNMRARSPTKDGPQPRGFSAPGAVGSCPPNMPFPQMRNDQGPRRMKEYTDDEYEEFLKWRDTVRDGRSYTQNSSYKNNISDLTPQRRRRYSAQDVRDVPRKQSFMTYEEAENEAYFRSYVKKDKGKRDRKNERRHFVNENFASSSDDDTVIVIDDGNQNFRPEVPSSDDSDDQGFDHVPRFNPTSNPGPPQYYRLFPRPWNVVPDYDSPKDAKLLNTVLNSHLIPKMKDVSHLAYIAWRGGFISNIHRMNCPLHTKIQAIIALMSDQVKERIGKITSYTPQNYLRLVRRLEEKFGSAKDLVREMTSNIKKLKQVKVGKITDLERYEQCIEEYMSALKISGRRDECKAENTLQQVIQPLPLYYQNQYQEYLNQTARRDNALSLHKWVRAKIQDMISVHRRRGKSPDPDDVKKNFVNVTRVGDDDGNDISGRISIEGAPEPEVQSGSNDVDIDDEYEDAWYSFLTTPKTESKVCKLCSKPSKQADHYMRECPLMAELPESANRAIFKEFGMCFKCGRADGHGAKQCSVVKACKKCDSKFHHTLLHNQRKKQ